MHVHWCLPRRVQRVARSAHGVDKRAAKRLVDLSAKPADVSLYNICVRVEVKLPDVLKQHGSSHYLLGVTHEVLEEAEFPGL